MYNIAMGDNDSTPGVSVSLVNELYQRYWRELCGYIRTTFGNGPPEPEDIVQAAFTKFAEFDNPANIKNPRAWLYAVSRNLVHDHRRGNQVREAYRQQLQNSPDHAEEDETSPEQLAMERQRLTLIVDVLKKMPRRRSRIVLLNRLDNISASEIARRLGISEAAVRKQINKALRECIKAFAVAGYGEHEE